MTGEMSVEDLPQIDPNVDYTQILPIQQKRTIAFVNHFVMNTVSFLNDFAQSCESRFMDFEYKLQKVEASLLILEAQLSSIPGLDSVKDVMEVLESTDTSADKSNGNEGIDLPEIVSAPEESEVSGIKACEDSRYKKFFKMVQFGVPEPAVKLKMQNEGIDPSILDAPNAVLPGAVVNLEHSNNNSESE